MQIHVMIEPSFRHSYWCKQAVNGILAEVKRKKYALHFLDEPPANPSAVFGDNPRLVIVIGTSISWIPQVLRSFEANGIHAILINYDFFSLPASHSVVHMDYVNAMQRLMGYFYHYGRRRIALFGSNPNSSSDRIKEQFFMLSAPGSEAHVFRNYGSIQECFDRFLPHAHEYDALICANDLVAVAALKHLRKAGIDVPGKLLLAGFGESILAQKVEPTLTTATLHHEEMGRQAVTLFAYMYRQNAHVTASVQVECELVVRASTLHLPALSDMLLQPADSGAAAINFYKDAEVQQLLELEEFYFGLDSLDQEILALLEQNVPLEEIAERCQTSTSTIGYRIRSMQQRSGASTRQELLRRVSLHS